MKKTLSAMVLLSCLFVAACGGGGGATNCAARSGFYEATMTDSGSCGLSLTMVLSIDDIDGPASDCTATSSSTSDDNCQVLLDLDCELESGSMTVHRFIEWSEDGNSGDGTVLGDVYDSDGAYVCTVNATLAYQKQ